MKYRLHQNTWYIKLGGMMRAVIGFGLLLVVFSCAKKPNTPEGALTKFVNYRFSGNQVKEKLLEMTSGEFYESIARMSEEAFNIFSSMPVKKKSFKILKTQCGGTECSITYFIRYDSFKDGSKDFSVEAKKIAILKNVEGMWKIAEVSNIKEFHDAEESIEVIGK